MHLLGLEFFFQFHAVSRIQQCRQREACVKTLRFPLFVEFCRHYVLSGRTQRHAWLRHYNEEMKILNILFRGLRIHDLSRYSHTLMACCHDWSGTIEI